MNTMTTTRITRPPNIGDDDPCPVPLNNTFILKCQALYTNGQPVNLTGAKIYLHIKADPTDADVAAKVSRNTTSDASYFSVDSTALGLYTVTVPAGDFVAASMAADTNYYIDTEIILSGGGVFTHVYDVIRPFKQVTTAIS